MSTSTEEKEEIFSTPYCLKFLGYTPESFAGIHTGMQFVIFMGDEQKTVASGRRIDLNDSPAVGFVSDQGTRKTSNLALIQALMGGTVAKNSINSEDKNVKGELEFIDEVSGIRYISRITKHGFTLIEYPANGGKRKELPSPQATLQRLIGPLGISPMSLKNMTGKKQIEFIRSLVQLSDEQLKFEKELVDKIDIKFKERTGVNNTIRHTRKEIEDTEYYFWEEENKVFHATEKYKSEKEKSLKLVDDKDLLEEFKQITELNEKYAKSVDAIPGFKQQKIYIEDDIVELERKLLAKKEELRIIEERIANGEKWIEDNKTVPEQYEAVFTRIQNSGDLKVMAQNIKVIDEKMAKYDEAERQQIMLTDAIEKQRSLYKQFVKEYTPKIEDFEIVVAGLEDVEKEEGMYYKSRTILELSESELWDLYIQLITLMRVRVMIIENILDLGTDAIDRVNWFLERGGKVFYSAMERGTYDSKIMFLDKIPK